jgi:hypothetical protein
MSASDSKSLPDIGFLTVVEHDQHGLFGGYLVLNGAGRPLEFHCTAPVKPNRAQEILYGPTLKPFLYGEQIGKTLMDRGRKKPQLVCTDVVDVLSVRQLCTTPVALVHGSQTSELTNDTSLLEIEFGSERILILSEFSDDRVLVSKLGSLLEGAIDLSEPFGRIHAAIQEAQRGSKAA